MAAVLRNSALYDNLFAKKYLGDARDREGRVVPLPFELVILSPTTVGDTYNLEVIPANAKVVGLELVTEALAVSAGVNCTVQLGDSGDDDRYMAALDADVVNASGKLASAGAGYKPTVDTIVVLKTAGAAAIVGRKVSGCIWIIPPA